MLSIERDEGVEGSVMLRVSMRVGLQTRGGGENEKGDLNFGYKKLPWSFLLVSPIAFVHVTQS